MPEINTSFVLKTAISEISEEGNTKTKIIGCSLHCELGILNILNTAYA